MGLFDSPTHLLIILAVLVVLFGSAKLPKAAKSMGEAMRIFKKESAKLHDEDSSKAEVQASAPQQVTWEPQPAPQQAAPPQQATQDQMLALQEQMDALQKQMAAQQPTATQPAPATPPSATAPETQHTTQP